MTIDKLFFYKEPEFNNFTSNSNFVFVIVDISGSLQKREIKDKLKKFVNNEKKWKKIVKETTFGLNLIFQENDFNLKNHFVFKKNINIDSFLNKIINKPLKKYIPMWKLFMINNKNKTHLIFKCNHIYGDGYYLMNNIFIKYFMDNPINSSFLIREKNEKNETNKKYKSKKNNFFYIFKIINFLLISFLMVVFIFMYLFNYFINCINNKIYNKMKNKKKMYKMKTNSLIKLNVNKCKLIKNKYKISMNTLIHYIILKSLYYYYKKDTINFLSIFANLNSKNKHFNVLPYFETFYFSNNETNDHLQGLNTKIELKKKIMNNGLLHNFSFGITDFINKYTHSFLTSLYYDFFPNFDVSISNFHSYLRENTINNKKITNIYNSVIMHEIKLLFTCCSYDNYININLVCKKKYNIEKLKKCLKNVLCELSY